MPAHSGDHQAAKFCLEQFHVLPVHSAAPAHRWALVTDNTVEGKTTISAAHFAEQMELLADEGFVTVGIADLVRHMKGEAALPAKAVVLTFEDGWRSVLNAMPVLDKHKLKASFWIITGNGIGGHYLDWSDIERLAANPRYEVYSHTVSHPILTRLTAENARAEIAGSRDTLEALLDAPVTSFAYPNGKAGDDYSGEHAALVRSIGFAYGLSTNPGAARIDSDLMQLPRFTPWDRTSVRFGARLLANLARTHRRSRSDPDKRERIEL